MCENLNLEKNECRKNKAQLYVNSQILSDFIALNISKSRGILKRGIYKITENKAFEFLTVR